MFQLYYDAEEARRLWKKYAVLVDRPVWVSPCDLPPPPGWRVEWREVSVYSRTQWIPVKDRRLPLQLTTGRPEHGWYVTTYMLEGNAPFPAELQCPIYNQQKYFFIRLTTVLERGKPKVSCDTKYDLFRHEPHRTEFPFDVEQVIFIKHRRPTLREIIQILDEHWNIEEVIKERGDKPADLLAECRSILATHGYALPSAASSTL